MTKKTTYLLGILLTIIIGTILYHFTCCCCCAKSDVDNTGTVATTNLLPKSTFALDGNEIKYSCNNSFNFLKGDFKKILPVSDSINIGIDQLKNAFAKGGQKLLVTGYCLSSEKNDSEFENLGLARANDVKNYFISKGISADQIETKGVVKDDLTLDNTTVYGPVDFLISNVTANETTEDFGALKASINANPLTLYFNTGQNSNNLSDSDKKKVADIVRYIDNVKDAKIEITGYTDNVGNQENNIALGQKRANFARNYLVKNGIVTEKIESQSKGADSPVESNETAAGREKNRRTEVKIK